MKPFIRRTNFGRGSLPAAPTWAAFGLALALVVQSRASGEVTSFNASFTGYASVVNDYYTPVSPGILNHYLLNIQVGDVVTGGIGGSLNADGYSWTLNSGWTGGYVTSEYADYLDLSSGINVNTNTDYSPADGPTLLGPPTITHFDFHTGYDSGGTLDYSGFVDSDAHPLPTFSVEITITHLTSDIAVPEPCSLALLGLGSLGVIAARRFSSRREVLRTKLSERREPA